MHKKIFLKIIIIILFVNLSYSSSNNFFQKMHEGTYIPILLPDNNYRWDQWQFSINTESNDLILQNGFILNNDEIIYDEELNINGEFEPGTPPPNVEGINTGLLPKTGDVTVPDKWSFSTSGTGNKGYDNQTYTISFNITSEPLHTTAWTSDYFPINNSQTYTLVFEVKTNETDPFVYAQFRNAANNGYITSGIFTGSTEWEKKYVTFTNTDNHQTKVILKSFNNGPIYMEFRNISFYEGNYVSDDLPENWTVSKDVNVTQTLENGIFSFNLPSIKSASIRYTYYNLSAGDYLFSAETNGSVETMYVQTQEVGEVGYIVSNQFYLDGNEYIPTQAYLSLNESKNITFYLKVNSLQGNVSFKNASLKKIGEIEELGWEFTNGYRLYVAQVSENVCNGFDKWCGGGHGGDINIVKNFSYLNKNFIQYKRTATNPLFNSTIYYTYDIDNFKVYENYNFEFNQSANLSLLNDDYFYVGMQAVRNVKVTNELWKNGINIYNHSLISEGGEPQSYEEGTIHVLRSNNSLESNNYSYVYRSNVFDERIALQSTTYGYNKKYFVLKDKDIKYPNWQTEGINVYVHWDTIKGAEIPETLLNDTWAPDVILFSDGNYTNLNSHPDKQIQINKEDNKITIYSNDEVNIELREYNTAYVDGEENTNYRIYDVENNTNITNVLKNEIISPLNQTYNTKNILLEINSTGDDVWYNWNGTNYTYTNPITIEFNESNNTIHVWANDTIGNENYTNVTFTIEIIPETPSSGGSSSSKTNPSFSYEWDCETGILEIETEEEIEVRLMSLRDFSTYKNTTDNNGIVSFTLAMDGLYRIFTGVNSDYYSITKDVTFEFCEEEIETEIIIPEVNETNNTNETEFIIPVVNETIEEEINVSEIEDLIELVESELENSINENKEVSEAQEKLNQAKVEFNKGNYELAEQLTNEALTLILSAQAQQPDKNETEIEGNVTKPIEDEIEVKEEINWLWLIVGFVFVGVVVFFGYKYLNKHK